MDPDKALKDARKAVKQLRKGVDNTSDITDDLLEAFEALDGWLSKGGFLPKAWNTEAVTDGQFVDQG